MISRKFIFSARWYAPAPRLLPPPPPCLLGLAVALAIAGAITGSGASAGASIGAGTCRAGFAGAMGHTDLDTRLVVVVVVVAAETGLTCGGLSG